MGNDRQVQIESNNNGNEICRKSSCQNPRDRIQNQSVGESQKQYQLLMKKKVSKTLKSMTADVYGMEREGIFTLRLFYVSTLVIKVGNSLKGNEHLLN